MPTLCVKPRYSVHLYCMLVVVYTFARLCRGLSCGVLIANAGGAAKLVIISNNTEPIRKSEIEYYAMLSKTGVHHYSGSEPPFSTHLPEGALEPPTSLIGKDGLTVLPTYEVSALKHKQLSPQSVHSHCCK
jgi:hypothetical protein